MSAMSKLSASALLGAGLMAAGFSGPAHASVVYDLTLTATYDSNSTPLSTYDGTGTITLSSVPSATGLTNEGSAAVTFLVDGESFSGIASSVQFQDGSFWNATFSEQIGSSPLRFTLDTSGVYAFYYDNGGQDASGTISSALAATPLPAALPLFAGGLGLLGLMGRRRKQKLNAVAA
jgi:hypothetical protein